MSLGIRVRTLNATHNQKQANDYTKKVNSSDYKRTEVERWIWGMKRHVTGPKKCGREGVTYALGWCHRLSVQWPGRGMCLWQSHHSAVVTRCLAGGLPELGHKPAAQASCLCVGPGWMCGSWVVPGLGWFRRTCWPLPWLDLMETAVWEVGAGEAFQFVFHMLLFAFW